MTKSKIASKISEIKILLEKNHISADVGQFDGLPVITVDINHGDWKHDHLRSRYLIEQNVKDVSPFNSIVTEENGSDCYSAQYRYLLGY